MAEVVELIDVDSHLGPLPDAPVPYTDPVGLAESQARLRIAGCVLTAVPALLHDPAVGNTATVELAAAVPGAAPAVMLTPPVPGEPSVLEQPAWAEAALATAAPEVHGWALTDPAMAPVYRRLADLGRPLRVSSHAGWSEIERFADGWPQVPVLVTDVGYRALRRLAGVLQRHPSVHVVTSNFSTHEGIEWFVERFGHDRLLFGTGAPWHDPGSAVAQLRWSALDHDDLVAVGRGNAVRLMPGLAPGRAARTASPTGHRAVVR